MGDPSRNLALALVTAPDLRTARRLAKAAVRERLAACANLVPQIESHYWWKGKVEHGREVLIVFKTATRLLGKLEALVIREHPYDTPEFIVVAIRRGNRRYLQWWVESVA